MKTYKLLVTPPLRPGGGPTNAVLRCTAAMSQMGVGVTKNIFSNWDAALLNVGLGVRFDALKLAKFGRRVVFRADGCYVRETFEREGSSWKPEYDQINARIKLALQSSDFVIYQSTFSKAFLDQILERPKQSWAIIQNGVNTDGFSPSGRETNPLPVVGCIGYFRKGRVQTITDIVKNLPFKHKLLLVGRMDEQCREDLIDLQKNSGESIVEYISPVYDDVSLANWHKKIDCFIHPVIGDTSSNAVIESLACGTPVVLPKFSGSSALIGKGGITIKTESWIDYNGYVTEFVSAVSQIIDNWSDYSLQARKQAVETLDVEIMAKKYMAVVFPRGL